MQLLVGHDRAVAQWAARKIDGLCQPTHAFGLLDAGVLRGCVILNEITRNTAELVIYSEARIGPGILRQVFKIPFMLLGYGRLQTTVQRSNSFSRKQTPRWGFKFDGTAHDFFAPGEHALRFVMLKQNCRWLGKRYHGTVQQAESPQADGRGRGDGASQRAEHGQRQSADGLQSA